MAGRGVGKTKIFYPPTYRSADFSLKFNFTEKISRRVDQRVD